MEDLATLQTLVSDNLLFILYAYLQTIMIVFSADFALDIPCMP